MKTNYIMIDMENVVPDNLELLDQDWVKVLLFVGGTMLGLGIFTPLNFFFCAAYGILFIVISNAIKNAEKKA